MNKNIIITPTKKMIENAPAVSSSLGVSIGAILDNKPFNLEDEQNDFKNRMELDKE